MTAQEGLRWGCRPPGIQDAGSVGRQAGRTWAGPQAAAALVVDHGHTLDAEAALAIPRAGVKRGRTSRGQPPIISHALTLHGML